MSTDALIQCQEQLDSYRQRHLSGHGEASPVAWKPLTVSAPLSEGAWITIGTTSATDQDIIHYLQTIQK